MPVVDDENVIISRDSGFLTSNSFG